MRYKIPNQVPKHVLISAPLPQNTHSYTVVPNQVIIDKVENAIKNSNFKLIKESYRAIKDGTIAHGSCYIEPITPEGTDSDLGITFNWTNSYNKQVKFNCCIGGYVKISENVIIPENINYSRKHTGVALYDIDNQITNQLKNAENVLNKIIDQKNYLKTITVSKAQQAELLGRMYYIEDLLEITNVSAIKEQLKFPTYHFNLPEDNGWLFYNNVLQVIKTAHPVRWMSVLSKYHEFMVAELIPQADNSEENQPKITVLNEESEEIVNEEVNDEIQDDSLEEVVNDIPEISDNDFEFEL